MTGYTPLAALLGLGVAVVMALYALAKLVAVARGPYVAAQFTGGPPPVEHAVSRFHMRWYAVTMLFLAFDMEMIFMYPWVRVLSAMGKGAVIEMFLFLAVLLAGVVYAWREGALRWA